MKLEEAKKLIKDNGCIAHFKHPNDVVVDKEVVFESLELLEKQKSDIGNIKESLQIELKKIKAKYQILKYIIFGALIVTVSLFVLLIQTL